MNKKWESFKSAVVGIKFLHNNRVFEITYLETPVESLNGEHYEIKACCKKYESWGAEKVYVDVYINKAFYDQNERFIKGQFKAIVSETHKVNVMLKEVRVGDKVLKEI